MNNDIDHGFDWLAVRHRLEDWVLEFFASPVHAEPSQWPAGRHDAVRTLLFTHWSEHGLPTLFCNSGRLVAAPRCSAPACPVLGVALAILELDAYEATLVERSSAAELRRQAESAGLNELERGQLLARAHHVESTPLSSAVRERTRGRPKRCLAQAMSQHLAQGSFSQSQIARFMADKADNTRKRIVTVRVWTPRKFLSGRASCEPHDAAVVNGSNSRRLRRDRVGRLTERRRGRAASSDAAAAPRFGSQGGSARE
jgi:hypothetical protein